MAYLGYSEHVRLIRKLSSTPNIGYVLMGIGVIVIGLVLYQIVSFDSAALLVESNVEASVFINGEEKGKTPLEMEVKEEEIVLRLVPADSALPPYDTKVNLTEGTKTIVRREFGESIVTSSSQVVQLEKVNTNGSEIAIVSIPDGVDVSLDGQKLGSTPLRFMASPGEHTLNVSSAGHKDVSLRVVAVYGYVVNVVVSLAAK
ncbi:hypothetical protein A2803_01120 [Candidatus Woesebacteria bacterium RIFCSPHIGHO2_01_FULL_44_21]|uniref:PEGA domain-containing protein n=1 Tax=Candidatus Woesebacteria bacterium RIFCSPHIGHO2_01_FULL_44_21 TaxID=1802503 RepID=A0A1F7YYR8_9BACT|nr:MAG: hypothetical protein A2803_01120 [Candidatus Woesebacteria bacterium RIFCSPHIGHO2_01_FULL_44_21]OGM69734.1 MAG: hypothetical protein A2897_00310 [Candidatus Woesebacteria bacterium RIFCSPLOWO2_01_FULL_44_24b]